MADDRKDPNAVALGRKGGLVGGPARAAKLSAEALSESGRKAALARWGEALPRATHQGVLSVGDIPCFVLEGTHPPKRVLSQGGLLAALGMKRGSNPNLGSDRLANFAVGKSIKPFISEALARAIKTPIKFRSNAGGSIAFGYEATALADICEAVLAAREAGALHHQQIHIAI
jgi:hypothetical protein